MCNLLIVILIFHFKRLLSLINKNNSGIAFPIQITLNQNIYNLYGICYHFGVTQGGHYFAVCKNQLDNLWRQYNDSHVSLVEKKDLQKFTPYLFFYKRL